MEMPSVHPDADCLIKLGHGDGEICLVLFHTVSGSVGCYRPLAALLEGYARVYGVRAIGRLGNREPFATLAAMCEYYAEQIRLVARDKVCLCGWSTGGLIAIEVAERLKSVGLKVMFLGLLDTGIYTERLYPQFPRQEFMRRGAWRVLGYDLLGRTPEGIFETNHRFWRGSDEDRLKSLIEECRTSGISEFWKNASDEQFHVYWDFLKLQWKLLREDYRPKTYDDGLVFFQASESDDWLSQNHWRALVRGDFDVRILKGGHGGIVRSPHVLSTAQNLWEAIQTKSKSERIQ